MSSDKQPTKSRATTPATKPLTSEKSKPSITSQESSSAIPGTPLTSSKATNSLSASQNHSAPVNIIDINEIKITPPEPLKPTQVFPEDILPKLRAEPTHVPFAKSENLSIQPEMLSSRFYPSEVASMISASLDEYIGKWSTQLDEQLAAKMTLLSSKLDPPKQKAGLTTSLSVNANLGASVNAGKKK